MNSPQFSGPDPVRSRLRATLATIEGEISRLPKQATEGVGNPTNGLRSSFNDLVLQLALGPEPEVRECPACKVVGIREATVCGFCWTKLTPPARREGVA